MAKTRRAAKVYRKKTSKTGKKRMNKKHPRTRRRRRRGGNSQLISQIKESLRNEMVNGNLTNSCYQCLIMKNVVGKMVRDNLEEWDHLTVGQWTKRILNDNKTCIICIKDALHNEMLEGNIDNECYQCLLKNNAVEKMINQEKSKWGDLTVSEWTTRVLHDNTECPNCIILVKD